MNTDQPFPNKPWGGQLSNCAVCAAAPDKFFVDPSLPRHARPARDDRTSRVAMAIVERDGSDGPSRDNVNVLLPWWFRSTTATTTIHWYFYYSTLLPLVAKCSTKCWIVLLVSRLCHDFYITLKLFSYICERSAIFGHTSLVHEYFPILLDQSEKKNTSLWMSEKIICSGARFQKL